MAIDGTFIHYLTEELSSQLKGGRVSKVSQLNNLEYIFEIRTHGKNYALLLSTSLNAPRLHLTSKEYVPMIDLSRLGMFFKRNIERSLLESMSQIGNDRCLKLVFSTTDDIGDPKTFWVFLEIMGRNSNLIVTDDNYQIIDAARYLPPSPDNYRIVIPKAKYVLPYQEDTINPFEVDNDVIHENFCGVSKTLLNEFKFQGRVKDVLNQKINPTLINDGKKVYFYAYDLLHLSGTRSHFPTLSALLDHIYGEQIHDNSSQVVNLKRVVKRHLSRLHQKIANLKDDFQEAKNSLSYQKKGELLQSFLYLVKKGDGEVIVNDYYNNNEPFLIKLNPTLDPSKNLENFFKKAKKAKTAIKEITDQIKLTLDEIDYLELIDFQIDHANNLELKEIEDELISNNYLKPSKKRTQKLIKSKLLAYQVDDAIIYVGKNNYQNNYLTNKMASSDDYFFHVKDYQGAHVIVKCEKLTEKIIRTASMLAAEHSKGRLSSSIPVDYTLVKYVKKIPGMKGHQVSYKNHKTIFIDIDEEYLKSLKKI